MLRILSGIILAVSILHAGPARHPSYEPVAPPARSEPNLFLDANVTASGHWDRQKPDRAVNGKLDPDDHWACENLPVWHQVNLPRETELGAIRIWPYWPGGRVYQYKIEGSVDANTWTTLVDMTANSIASTAEGILFTFEPVRLKHVRTTFTGNSRGKENGGHLVEIEGYAKAPNTDLTGGIGTTDARYPPHGPIDSLQPVETGVQLHAWRGERVNAQVVVASESAHEALRFGEAVLTNGANRIRADARFVRYTLANGDPQGDILDSARQLDLPAGSNRPVWIEADVPADALPGIYTGTLIARSNRSQLAFPIRLEVLPATLPPPSEWRFHLDLWQHPDSIARWHDVEPWSDEHLALMRPLMRRLADAGQKTITTTLIHEPWNGQTYDAFESMITWRKRADGTWHYDYSIFDRWVSFMTDQCGFELARIHGYSMIPWSLRFRYFDESENRWVDAKLQPGSKTYDDFWGPFLRDFKRHLSTKGWLERTRIAVDERPDHLVRGALASLQRHAPELLVSSAVNHVSGLTRDLDDISTGIAHVDRFPRILLDKRRAAGHVTTFYICTNPPLPNTFTFSPPAESEWLPLFAAANGFDGMLRWAYNSWVENPLVSTDFTSWPSGDCFIVYPGNRSSVRFERLRDGIESFEKIRLLRELAARTPDKDLTSAVSRVEEALQSLTLARGSTAGVHAGDVRTVNQLLLKATRAACR